MNGGGCELVSVDSSVFRLSDTPFLHRTLSLWPFPCTMAETQNYVALATDGVPMQVLDADSGATGAGDEARLVKYDAAQRR